MKYSGEQINAAGIQFIRKDLIDDENAYAAVLDVLSYWRSEHEVPLKNALETVQKVALLKDRKAIFAKRLKRSVSIGKKLNRWSTMKLRTMQDIGGGRAIVSNRKKLYQIFRELKSLKGFKWKDGKHRVKDYIESPKEDGYRSVHIIGTFKGETAVHRRIEIQLRTYIQHYWATALEIVELFTHQALKSNQGDIQWLNFFKDVGEHFAQMDGIHLFEAMLPGNKLR